MVEEGVAFLRLGKIKGIWKFEVVKNIFSFGVMWNKGMYH